MARNASGEYTLPSGNPVVTDTQITSTWGNTTLSDVATEMTASLSRTGKGGMLAPLKTINGTVGAPVYTFTNFPTSGLYIAGAGDVRMSVTGVDRMRWLASGSAPQVRNAAEDGWTDIGSVALTNEATDTTCFPIFATAATGNQAAKTNTTFTFNSATGDVGIGGSLNLSKNGPVILLTDTDGPTGYNQANLFLNGNGVEFTQRNGSGAFLATLFKLDLKTSAGGGLDLATISGPLTTTGPVNSNVKLNTKVIDIGDWNMDTDVSKFVTHGLTLSKIRSLKVTIRDDTTSSIKDLIFDNSSSSDYAGYYSASASTIGLGSPRGGSFDNSDYSSTSYNRGWIVIEYID
jgi:hypothetical protein